MYFVNIGMIALQRSIKLIKAVGTPAQAFGIPAESEMLIYHFLDEVRKILHVHGTKELGQVVVAHCAKGPLQLIGLIKP
jgi:hypothetical protein